TVGLPGGEKRGERRVAQSTEVMGSWITRGVGHELRFVAGEQIDVPGKCLLELRIPLCCDPEFPEVKDAKLQRRMGGQPAKPRTVILGRMREDDSQSQS